MELIETINWAVIKNEMPLVVTLVVKNKMPVNKNLAGEKVAGVRNRVFGAS